MFTYELIYLNCSQRAPPPKKEQNTDDDWGESDRKQNNFNEDRGSDFTRGRGRGGGRGGGRGRDFNNGDSGERRPQSREGDWNCSDCSASNFASRNECFRCKTPKPDDAGNEGSGNRGFSERRGGSDRPPRRDQGENGENPEEKRREVYIPEEPTNEEDLFASAIGAGINFDNFDKIEVHVTGKGADDFDQINTFEEADLRDFLLNNVKKSGYKKTTPIQKRAIPIVKGKRDLMGCAQTGSGKTAAFVLPILNCIMNDKDTLNPGKPQCLIVAPTRELVIQIRDEALKFASGSYVKVALAYGGAASRYQSDNIVQGCHVLVATPGRLMDFVNKSIITFDDLKFLVSKY